MPVSTGDRAELRKPHPCGSTMWAVTRVGMDIGLQCEGCKHRVLLPRSQFERQLRRLIREGETHA
ncbi:MAG: DUF951 domain-containing protein [Chloroflexi bacterium]|nr:DUF951 domain-containing protein [Chloroflexota bacterium]